MEPQAIHLDLRVSPGGRSPVAVGGQGRAWKLRVVAQPERVRANDSVIDLLATALGLRRPDVRLAGGTVSRDKVAEIVGLTLDEAERRLDTAKKGSSKP